MRKITMADGTCLEVTYCGAADGFLWIRLPRKSVTVAEAAAFFGDPAATQSIVHDWDGNDRQEFHGYTDLRRIEKLESNIEILLREEKTDAV